MKQTYLITTLLVAFAVSAFASAPTTVRGRAIHARTFNFAQPAQKPVFADQRAAVHRMVQDAITKNLAARGVKRVASGGDLTVPYLVIKGDNASTEAIRDYFGYGDDLGDLHDKAQKKYTGTKNPNYFQAGTLLIDLVDGKSFKLLKRGHATSNLAAKGVSAAQIQSAVDQILGDVKIGP